MGATTASLLALASVAGVAATTDHLPPQLSSSVAAAPFAFTAAAAPNDARAAAEGLSRGVAAGLAAAGAPAYALPAEVEAGLSPTEREAWYSGAVRPSDLRRLTSRVTALLHSRSLPTPPPGAGLKPMGSDFEALVRASPYGLISHSIFLAAQRPPPRAPGAHPCVDALGVLHSHLPFCDTCNLTPDVPCPGATLARMVEAREVVRELPPLLREGGQMRAEAYKAATPEEALGLSLALQQWADVQYLTSGSPVVDSPPFLVYRSKLSVGGFSADTAAALQRVGQLAREAVLRLAQWATGALPGSFEQVALGSICALKPRLVADCSRFLNTFLPAWDFHYETPMSIAAAMTPDCLLCTRDVKGAYQHLRLHPDHRKYVGFHTADGAGYVYDGEAMGVRSACAAFSAVSAYVVWLCRKRGLDAAVALIPYIDDFTFVAPTAELMAAALAIFDGVCKDIGLFVDPADPKNVVPSTCVVALGLEFNSVAMTVGLPREKLLSRALDAGLLLGCVEAEIPVPTAVLRSFAGKVAHLASVFPEAASHVKGLHAPLSMLDGRGEPLRRLHLWKADSRLQAARAALRWVHSALSTGSLVSQRVLSKGPQRLINLGSDASGTAAWGCRVGAACFWGSWSAAQAPLSIAYKELWPLYCMLRLHGSSWAGSVLHVATDNLGNAYNINRLSANGDAAPLMRAIAELCVEFRVCVVACWLPREYNVFCDELSKCTSFAAARLVCSGSDCTDLSSFPSPPVA